MRGDRPIQFREQVIDLLAPSISTLAGGDLGEPGAHRFFDGARLTESGTPSKFLTSATVCGFLMFRLMVEVYRWKVDFYTMRSEVRFRFLSDDRPHRRLRPRPRQRRRR